jgi:DNA polymerase I
MINGVRFIDAPCPPNVHRIDHGALPMVHAMHVNGIRIDPPFLRSLQSRVEIAQLEIESVISSHIPGYQDLYKGSYTPFNIGSPDHVARLLFHHLQIDSGPNVQMTKKHKREAVDDEVLARYSKRHPVIPLIQDWRELEKLLGTYIIPFQAMAIEIAPGHHRIHIRANVTNVATGRLSMSYLQTIPIRTELGREVRNAFIASPGCQLVSSDLSQIEMRWAAHRSQDATMLSVFRKREDIHIRTACNVFGHDYSTMAALASLVDSKKATPEQEKEYKYFKLNERLPCKTVGFGVLYGQTSKGLSQSLAKDGVEWDEARCADLIDNKFFGVYPGLRSMLERDHARARRFAMVWDDFGRVRLVPEAKSHHRRIAQEGIRKAGNHPEQSGGVGTCKLGMAALTPIAETLNLSHTCLPLLQVHDNLIFDVDSSIASEFALITQSEMESASPLTVPVLSSSDIGERLGEL